MKKSEHRCRLELSFPAADCASYVAALNSEDLAIKSDRVGFSASSLKEIRAYWNTVMRAVRATDDVLDAMRRCDG